MQPSLHVPQFRARSSIAAHRGQGGLSPSGRQPYPPRPQRPDTGQRSAFCGNNMTSKSCVPYFFANCPLFGKGEKWYNTQCFLNASNGKYGDIDLFQSGKTRNCVLCFSRKTTNFDTKKRNVRLRKVCNFTLRTPVLYFFVGTWSCLY